MDVFVMLQGRLSGAKDAPMGSKSLWSSWQLVTLRSGCSHHEKYN